MLGDLGIHLTADKRPWDDGVRVYFWRMEPRKQYVPHIEWKEIPEGSMEALPAIPMLTQSAAQELMDSLWQCGLRPSQGSGSAGSLAATERHLADMRKMVETLMSFKF